ncbi:MAG: carboxypeptidase-like regulatory domain-containing protein, partial [Fulvivirga sp.]
MRGHLFTLVLVLVFCNATAQNIKGTLVDKEDNSPLPYATITLMDKNGNIVGGGLSDGEGKFEVKLSDNVSKVE